MRFPCSADKNDRPYVLMRNKGASIETSKVQTDGAVPTVGLDSPMPQFSTGRSVPDELQGAVDDQPNARGADLDPVLPSRGLRSRTRIVFLNAPAGTFVFLPLATMVAARAGPTQAWIARGCAFESAVRVRRIGQDPFPVANHMIPGETGCRIGAAAVTKNGSGEVERDSNRRGEVAW